MSICKDFFTVVVIGDDFKPVKQIEPLVFALRHGQEYSIQLINHHQFKRANAKIFIDGKQILYIRIDKSASVTVDRPQNIASKFTFVNPSLCRQNVSMNPDLGVLKIEFELEQSPVVIQRRFNIDRGEDCVDGYVGETLFSSRSEQRFTQASSMLLDPTSTTTIRALMVVKE